MFDFTNFLFTLLGVPYQQLQQNVLHSICERQNLQKSEETASPLSKYIYLSRWGADEKAAFIEKCSKNFMVYMVTIDNCAEEQSCSGSTSPNLSKRLLEERMSSKQHLDSQSEKSSSCRSKVSKTINKRKRESNSRLYNFIKKLIPSKSSNRSKRNPSGIDEMFIREYNYQNDSFKEVTGFSGGNLLNQYTSPIPYIEQPLIGDCTSAETLREINDLCTRIEQSETSIKDLVVKYIQDPTIGKDLVNAVSGHGRLLGEIEKRSVNMANEHWIQQTEMYKDQQKNLQSTMNTIIHQNRELLEENETLSKKYEKLSAAMVVLQECSTGSNPKTPTISSRFILEDLSKNNDRLRFKVNTILSQVSEMEDSVKKFQKRSLFLQQQLNNAKVELYNTKVNYEKTKTDYELNLAKLTNELQSNVNVIKECTENGNVIMKDLEMLQMQLEPVTKAMNWDKFQKSSRTLPEIIHLNRICINELSNELIHKQGEINRANSEIENLKQSNSNLHPLKDEIQELQSKLHKSSNTIQEYENQLKSLKDYISSMEKKLEINSALISSKDIEIEAKEKIIKEREGEIHTLNETLTNSKTEYSQINYTTDKLRHENNALQLQVKGMAQVLTATGAGDIAKELANSQEKLTAVQTQYFTLIAENNILLKQIETNKSERQTLVAYQKSCYEQLQVLHKDIENLEKSNESLKEQLEREKQTVSALQNERVRHLEERTILTAIYERLKSEISKVDQLEGAVTTMNKKASKLAMIAEYNKQLGEKLQLEVAERDVAINELQNNVDQLNSFQMESTKEKVALCEELNKVFSVKEVLNTKLTAELEKNVILDESKKEIQNSANLQLKEIQAAYNREHAALKNLVKDVKELVAERDLLLEAKKTGESKCVNLILEQEKLVEFIKTLQIACKSKEEKLVEMDMLLEKRNNEFETLLKTNENDMGLLRSKFELVTSQTETLAKERDAMRSSLEYLQADLNKTRADLDNARESEHENIVHLEEWQNKYNSLCEDFQHKMMAIHQIIEENEELKMNVYSLQEKYKCLAEENERISQDSIRLETQLAEKFQTYKLAGQPTPKHIENVLDDINVRDDEILILQDRLREFEERGMEMNDLLRTISENRDAFERKSKDLEQQLSNVIIQFQNAERRTQELENVIQELQTRRVSVEQLEEQQHQFTMTMERMKNEYNTQFQELAEELHDIETKKGQENAELEEAKENVEKYKEAHEKLQKAHKVLALKLFTAVRVLICEKMTLENTQTKLKNLEQERNELLEYKKIKEEEIATLKKDINTLQVKLQTAKEDNESIAKDVNGARILILELEEKLKAPAVSPENENRTLELQNAIKEQDFRILNLKAQLDECRKNSNDLQGIITNLESSCACMEFDKSEAELRLHELQTQMQSELSANEEMKHVMQTALSLIIEMKEKCLITPFVHNAMLQLFQEVHM